ncbi:hypothetical protein Tco_1505617 [Tanacetum coccineum]
MKVADFSSHFMQNKHVKLHDNEVLLLLTCRLRLCNYPTVASGKAFNFIQRARAVRVNEAAEPFEEPLIVSVEDRVGPNKNDVLGRCMLLLQYVERRLDHKAINIMQFNLEKHVMMVEGERKKEVKEAQRKRVKYEAKCADLGYAFLPFSFFYLEELEGCGDLIEADPKVLHDPR